MAEAERADAVALGPGLGRSAEAHALVGAAARAARASGRRRRRCALRPPAGDALPSDRAHAARRRARDGSSSRDSAWVDAHRLEAAREAAERFGAVVLLKGADTIVQAAHGGPVVCDTGPPSLATAGTGDVLTGVVAAFLAKGLDPVTAAAAAATAHGLAAASVRTRPGSSRATSSPRCHGCSPERGLRHRGRRWTGGSLERVRVEILGSGGAATIPRPGCRCRVCVEARSERRSLRTHRPVDLRARAEHPLRHAGGVEAAARAGRDRRDRGVLLLALASGSHDGTSRLGDAQRRLSHVAARGEAAPRHRRLPPAAGRHGLSHLARRDGSPRVHARPRLDPDPRAARRRDGRDRRRHGAPVPPRRGLRLRLRADGGRTSTARRDGRAQRLVAAARGNGLRPGGAADGDLRVRPLHRRAPDPRGAPGPRLRGDVRRDARHRRRARRRPGRAEPCRGDGLHLVRRAAPGRAAAAGRAGTSGLPGTA